MGLVSSALGSSQLLPVTRTWGFRGSTPGWQRSRCPAHVAIRRSLVLTCAIHVPAGRRRVTQLLRETFSNRHCR